jgi:pilus assembly protein Flp/PilA
MMKVSRYRSTHRGSASGSSTAARLAAAGRPLIAAFRGRVQMRLDHGATAVEYGLMVGLIAVVIVGGVTIFGQNVSQLFIVPAGVL